MYGYETRNINFYFSPTIENIEYESHLHKEVELLYVLDGNVTIQSNYIQYSMYPGDFYISFPNTVHECKSVGETHCMLWIFNVDIIKDYSVELKRRYPIVPILRKEQFHADLHYAIKAFNTRPDLTEDTLLSRAFLSLMMSHIIDNLQYSHIGSGNNEDWMMELLLYLNDRYSDVLTLDKIASHVGVSRYHLSRTFSAKIGCSIPDYINKLRIAKAIEFINHSDDTITEIAYKCGFESMTTFFRTFKKNGMPTPTTIRKNNKKK